MAIKMEGSNIAPLKPYYPEGASDPPPGRALVLDREENWRLCGAGSGKMILPSRARRAWASIIWMGGSSCFILLKDNTATITGLRLIGEGSVFTIDKNCPWDGEVRILSDAGSTSVGWTEVYERP